MRQFTVTYSMLYNFSAHLHKDIDIIVLVVCFQIYNRGILGLIIINRGADIKWLVCCKESTTVNLINPHNHLNVLTEVDVSIISIAVFW